MNAERRLLLTLGCAACDPAALAAAVRAAEALGARLAVRFVEDEELLHWAALPFTREVTFGSARPREFDVAAMERSLRAAADAARLRLERLVGDARRFSFEVRRGAPALELRSALGEADVVIGHPDDRGGWIALLRAQPQAEDVALLLTEVARRSGWNLDVLVIANEQDLAARLRRGAYDEDPKRRKHGG